MHLGLVDVLRCPAPHEATSLIATIDRAAEGVVERGALACPICDARYAIEAGAVVFSPTQRARCWPQDAAQGAARTAARASDPERALRAAALLGLLEPGGLIVLGGGEAALAGALRDRVELAVVLLNPLGPVAAWDAVTPVYADRLPIAPGSLRGALLGTSTAGSAADLVEALRPGARLVAPVSVAVPAGIRELARDDEVWVGEREAGAATAPVRLTRGRPL